MTPKEHERSILERLLDYLMEKHTFSIVLHTCLAAGFNRYQNDGDPFTLDDVYFDADTRDQMRWNAKYASLQKEFAERFFEAGGNPCDVVDVAWAVWQWTNGPGKKGLLTFGGGDVPLPKEKAVQFA